VPLFYTYIQIAVPKVLTKQPQSGSICTIEEKLKITVKSANQAYFTGEELNLNYLSHPLINIQIQFKNGFKSRC
jgi:hypothetical protein